MFDCNELNLRNGLQSLISVSFAKNPALMDMVGMHKLHKVTVYILLTMDYDLVDLSGLSINPSTCTKELAIYELHIVTINPFHIS